MAASKLTLKSQTSYQVPEGPQRSVNWMLDVWLKGRLQLKKRELDGEFRKEDKRSNRYHAFDFTRMQRDFKLGIDLLRTADWKTVDFLENMKFCDSLQLLMRECISTSWFKRRKGSSFVEQLKCVVEGLLKQVISFLRKMKRDGLGRGLSEDNSIKSVQGSSISHSSP